MYPRPVSSSLRPFWKQGLFGFWKHGTCKSSVYAISIFPSILPDPTRFSWKFWPGIAQGLNAFSLVTQHSPFRSSLQARQFEIIQVVLQSFRPNLCKFQVLIPTRMTCHPMNDFGCLGHEMGKSQECCSFFPQRCPDAHCQERRARCSFWWFVVLGFKLNHDDIIDVEVIRSIWEEMMNKNQFGNFFWRITEPSTIPPGQLVP